MEFLWSKTWLMIELSIIKSSNSVALLSDISNTLTMLLRTLSKLSYGHNEGGERIFHILLHIAVAVRIFKP